MTHEVRVKISSAADIVAARQEARALAVEAGFSVCDSTLITTAISEITRNVLEYAKQGEVTISLLKNGTKNGVKIVKFFLHISKDEQKRRFEQRLSDPNKNWKSTPADFEERKLWDKYTAAFEAALSKCNAEWAPWYVIPADKKWFRNLAVSQIIVEALESLNLKYPKVEFDPASIVIK